MWPGAGEFDLLACPEFHGDQALEAKLLIEQDSWPIRFIHMHREWRSFECVCRIECGRGCDLGVDSWAPAGLKFFDQL